MATPKITCKQQGLVEQAVIKLRHGGVIAYPTEYCFGLGCDPKNQNAVQRLLDIKQRKADQGLILIASTVDQIKFYADLSRSPMLDEIQQSWPGHTSWLLSAKSGLSKLLIGKHSTIAMRLSKHPLVKQLCDTFDGAIVSTSANRHGEAALLDAQHVMHQFGSELDYILDAPVGCENKPSALRDGISGEIIR